jgi:hypothetical protein
MHTRSGFSMRFVLVGCLAGGLIAASVEEAASQTNIQRDAPVRKFSGVEEIVFECTTSDATAGFVDMPGMTRSFTLAGSANEEVVVAFHATASLALAATPGLTSDTGYVLLQIDGAVQSPGNQIPFISTESSSPIIAAYSFTWQSAPLSPGSHTVLIQWRTDSGSEFCVDARSLIILHR